MKTRLSAAILAACVTAGPIAAQDLHDLLPQAIQDAGALQVGGPTAIWPYVYLDDDTGELNGLIIELMAAVSEELGVGFEFSNINYSALVPALDAGRVDIGIGTFTDTVERQEAVDFVDYITTAMVMMGDPERTQGIVEVADTCGYVAATPSGTTSERVFTAQAEACAAEGLDDLKLLVVPSAAEAQLQVQTGRADLFIQAYGVGLAIAQQDPKIQIVGNPLPREYHGAAVRKGNEELSGALMAGFQSIMDNGTYDEILASYGLSELGIDAPVFNGRTTAPLEN